MSISCGLFYFFSSLSILSSFFVITTKNPVFSILFLILSFVNVSCLLFLLNFEFLPISYLRRCYRDFIFICFDDAKHQTR